MSFTFLKFADSVKELTESERDSLPRNLWPEVPATGRLVSCFRSGYTPERVVAVQRRQAEIESGIVRFF